MKLPKIKSVTSGMGYTMQRQDREAFSLSQGYTSDNGNESALIIGRKFYIINGLHPELFKMQDTKVIKYYLDNKDLGSFTSDDIVELEGEER